MKLVLLAALIAPAALAQVRVEPRLLVKESHWFLSGGLSWLDRRDYYNSFAGIGSAAYYLRESDAIEVRGGVFASWLTDAGQQVVSGTAVVPDAHKPSVLLLGGWRHSLTYGKIATGTSVIHFDVQSGLHAGTLITDRATTPAASASLGVLARLGSRLFGQLDVSLLGSIEQRSSTVLAIGFMPILSIGASL